MTRLNAWIICCAFLLAAIAIGDNSVNMRVVIAMFTMMGIPLLVHWAWDDSDQPQKKEESV